MSKRGILELQTPSGWIEVEVGDPGVLPYSPIEVPTPSGWAAPRLVDPADADTPLEVQTASGWKGIARRVFRLVDSFEDHDVAEYYTSSTNWNVVHDTNKATHGQHALESNFGAGGNDAMWSDSGLSHYPSRGDTFKTNHRLQSNNNGVGVQFGCSGTGSNIFPNGYSVRLNFGNNGQFKIIHQNPGGGSGGEYTVASTPIDTASYLNTEHVEIETTFGSPTITSVLYDTNGNQIASVSGDDADWQGTGFGWISTIDATKTSNQYVWHDFARITA